MRFKPAIAYVLTFVWLCQGSAMARQKPPALPPHSGPVTWSELGNFIVGQKIEIRLSDRTKLQGEVLVVRPNSLVVDITRTSTRKTYPRGQAAVPRSSVVDLKLVRVQGPGRLVGGILGTVGGVFTGSMVAWYAYPVGCFLGPFVVLPIMGVTGYYAGKAADERRRRIILAPEPVAAELGQQAMENWPGAVDNDEEITGP